METLHFTAKIGWIVWCFVSGILWAFYPYYLGSVGGIKDGSLIHILTIVGWICTVTINYIMIMTMRHKRENVMIWFLNLSMGLTPCAILWYRYRFLAVLIMGLAIFQSFQAFYFAIFWITKRLFFKNQKNVSNKVPLWAYSVSQTIFLLTTIACLLSLLITDERPVRVTAGWLWIIGFSFLNIGFPVQNRSSDKILIYFFSLFHLLLLIWTFVWMVPILHEGVLFKLVLCIGLVLVVLLFSLGMAYTRHETKGRLKKR